MVVWETKIDLCRIIEGVRSSIIAKVIFENAMKASDRVIECPIPAGNHSYVDLLITNKYLPPFPWFLYPSGVGKFFFKCTIKGVLMNKTKYVPLYNYEVYGSGFNSDMFNTSL